MEPETIGSGAPEAQQDETEAPTDSDTAELTNLVDRGEQPLQARRSTRRRSACVLCLAALGIASLASLLTVLLLYVLDLLPPHPSDPLLRTDGGQPVAGALDAHHTGSAAPDFGEPHGMAHANTALEAATTPALWQAPTVPAPMSHAATTPPPSEAPTLPAPFQAAITAALTQAPTMPPPSEAPTTAALTLEPARATSSQALLTTTTPSEASFTWPKASTRKSRFVILFHAGMEGTGHHLVQAAMKSCYNSGTCVYSLGDFDINWKRRGQPEVIWEDFALKSLRAEIDNKSTILVPSHCSYPCNVPIDMPTRHENPRMDVMAQVAKEHDLDFRILLTLRDAEDMYCSTHERFQRRVSVTVQALEQLTSHLTIAKKLGIKIVCVDFDLLPKVPPTLNKRLGIDGLLDLEAMLALSFRPSKRKCTLSSMDLVAVEMQLRKGLEELRQFCK